MKDKMFTNKIKDVMNTAMDNLKPLIDSNVIIGDIIKFFIKFFGIFSLLSWEVVDVSYLSSHSKHLASYLLDQCVCVFFFFFFSK